MSQESKKNTGEDDTWIIEQKADNLWHWIRKSPNGVLVGKSHKGFKQKVDCTSNAQRHGYVRFKR